MAGEGLYDFEAVLQLLRRSPWLACSIRELGLRSQSGRSVLDVASLRNIIAQLPLLSALKLSNLALCVPHTFQPTAGSCKWLKRLTIGDDCTCKSQVTLAGVLSLFDGIDELVHHVGEHALKQGTDLVATRQTKLRVDVFSLVAGQSFRRDRAVESALAAYSQLADPNALTD